MPVIARPERPLLLDPLGGATRTDATIAALVRWTAPSLRRARVLEVAADGDAVLLRTDRGEHRCARCLVCAGTGTDRLAASAGVPIAQHRRVHGRLTFRRRRGIGAPHAVLERPQRRPTARRPTGSHRTRRPTPSASPRSTPIPRVRRRARTSRPAPTSASRSRRIVAYVSDGVHRPRPRAGRRDRPLHDDARRPRRRRLRPAPRGPDRGVRRRQPLQVRARARHPAGGRDPRRARGGLAAQPPRALDRPEHEILVVHRPGPIMPCASSSSSGPRSSFLRVDVRHRPAAPRRPRPHSSRGARRAPSPLPAGPSGRPCGVVADRGPRPPRRCRLALRRPDLAAVTG